MKALTGLLALVTFGSASVVACDSDRALEDGSAPSGDAGTDATAIPADASVDAAVMDAGRDATTDAASTCSVDGFCWTTLPPAQTLRAIWSDAEDSAWAVSSQGNVLRWDGAAWTIQWTSTGALFAVWASSATDVWVGGEQGLFHGEGTSPASVTWTPVPFDASIPVVDIAGSGPNDVWAIGNKYDTSTFPAQLRSLVRHFAGGVVTSEDAWTVDPISYRPGLFRKILVRADGDTWLAGDRDGSYPTPPAYVLHRVKGEGDDVSWVEQAIPVEGNDFVTRVDGAGFVGNQLRIAGWRGKPLLASTLIGQIAGGPGTETWTEDRNPVSVDAHFAVAGTSPNDVYLASAFGRFRHFDGTSWSLVRISIDGLPVVSDFRAMTLSPSGELWVVGDKMALHKKLP